MTDNPRELSGHDHQREQTASPERLPFRLHAGTLLAYSIGLTIPFLYLLHLIPAKAWPISPADLANAIPITRNRIEFLETLNPYDPHSYMVTFLGSIFASVLFSIAMIASYRRLVLVDGTRYPVTQDPTMPDMIKRSAMGVACFFAGMWICFIWVPWGYDIRYPGTAVLLFWPAFPFLAAVGTGMFACALTTLMVVLFEIMSRSRKK
ncbi:MAG: hypothetical protein NTX73_06035 [Rhodobacterales bacterium]|nr:hypothetical protein [Rhodobacterales bacterium]